MKRILDLFRKPEPVASKPAKKADYLTTYVKPPVVQRTTLERIDSSGIECRQMSESEIAEHFETIQSLTGTFRVVKPKMSEAEELADKVLGTRNSHL